MNQVYEQIIIHINCLNIALFMQKVYLITIAIEISELAQTFKIKQRE